MGRVILSSVETVGEIMEDWEVTKLTEIDTQEQEETDFYKGAFDAFDWNKSGRISTSDLQSALRRAGQNPTESEVQDMINKIDDGTASLNFPDFCLLINEKTREMEPETHFKDTFRVFSKDEEGCIPADEMKFVLMHLPGKVTYKEIDEMIETVDRNGDGKISFSEFRVMMGGFPLLVKDPVKKPTEEQKNK